LAWQRRIRRHVIDFLERVIQATANHIDLSVTRRKTLTWQALFMQHQRRLSRWRLMCDWRLMCEGSAGDRMIGMWQATINLGSP
jgi:hypothetical protein